MRQGNLRTHDLGLQVREIKAGVGRRLRDLTGWDRRTAPRSAKIICFQNQCMFVGVPKVASTSVKNYFESTGLLSGCLTVADPLDQVLTYYPHTAKLFKFAFVRNPWARLVSCYNDKIAGYGRDRNFPLATFHGLRPDMTFAEFAQWIHEHPEGQDDRADRHWMSQHCFLEVDGQLAVDFVGRYEALDEHWCQILRHLSLPMIYLEMKNATDITYKSEKCYREYYDSKTFQRIAERYARDIELFGYYF